MRLSIKRLRSPERGGRRKAPFGRWRGLAARLGLAVSAGIFLWLFGWVAVGDELLPIRWGAFAGPWLGLLEILAAGLLFFGARYAFAGMALVLAAVVLLPVWPQLGPGRWFAAPPPGNLRVMTFNASDMNPDVDAVARLIVHERPDIVFLQQLVDLPSLKARIAKLPGHLAYDSDPEKTADIVTLSRYPLIGHRDVVGRMTAIAQIDGCRVRLWNLHAPHGQYSVHAQKLYFEQLAADLHGETLPVILGGDLNSTAYNSVQAPLRNELQDAYARAGSGFGFTFPSHVRNFGLLGRLFRIDHIFFRGAPGLSLLGVAVSGNANSDHFAVVASFNLKSC